MAKVHSNDNGVIVLWCHLCKGHRDAKFFFVGRSKVKLVPATSDQLQTIRIRLGEDVPGMVPENSFDNLVHLALCEVCSQRVKMQNRTPVLRLLKVRELLDADKADEDAELRQAFEKTLVPTKPAQKAPWQLAILKIGETILAEEGKVAEAEAEARAQEQGARKRRAERDASGETKRRQNEKLVRRRKKLVRKAASAQRTRR